MDGLYDELNDLVAQDAMKNGMIPEAGKGVIDAPIKEKPKEQEVEEQPERELVPAWILI